MSKLRELRKLFDKIFFILLCVVLLALFIMLKSWDFKFGLDPGNGTGNGQPSVDHRTNNQSGKPQQSQDSQDQQPTVSPVQSSSEPSKVAKLFLGRQGVSENRTTWRDADQFSGFLQQLKEKGIKEVHYVLLPDSIERYEDKWKEELKKAKLIYAELLNDVETDGISLQP